MITVKNMKRQASVVILELDKGDPDPKNQYFHVIPDGTIEARMEQWNLETPEEALDLVITEAHPELPDIPDLLTVPDLKKARKDAAKAVEKAVQSIGWAKGVTREMVCAAAALDSEQGAMVRAVVADELATMRDRETIDVNTSMLRHVNKFKEISEGYAELQEQRLDAEAADKRRGNARDR